MDLSGDGCDALYINVDDAASDEKLLAQVVNIAQSYIKEPFILETNDAVALDLALRLYKGKAGVIINDPDSVKTYELLAIASKYGSTVLDRSIIG